MKSVLVALCLLSASVYCAADGHGYFMYEDFWCAVYSGQQQVEYLVDWYFNGECMMQYNSTEGGWRGLTAAGLIFAPLLNKDKNNILQRHVEKQRICVDNIPLVLDTLQDNTAEPSVTLVETSGFGNGAVLACSAFDFYPKHIRLTWRRNGQEVMSGVTFTEVTTNGDWTYQVHSYLQDTPTGQDAISCTVEHSSLKAPLILHHHSSFNWSERSFLIGGFCALLFAVVCLSSGIICYRRKLSNSV